LGCFPALIVVGGIVVSAHLWWKYLQDIGVGDKGADYPHKRLIPVYSKMIKNYWGSSEKNENEKKDP